MANWLADHTDFEGISIGRALVNAGIWSICDEGENCGAFTDLRVDSKAIRIDLNGTGNSNLNRNKVPSHAIVTTSSIAANNGLIANLLRRPFEFIVLGTSFESLFCGDPSDVIVPQKSQIGGLPAYSIPTDDQWHSGSMANPYVIQQMIKLLKARSTGSNFSLNGFGYGQLTYKDCPSGQSSVASSAANSTIHITSPQRGSYVKAGSQVTVAAQGTNLAEIKTIVSYSRDSIYIAREVGNLTNLPFQIDKLAGKRVVVTLGKTTSGSYVSDSTFFYVSENFCETVKSGNWVSGSTWSCGHTPTMADIVIVNPNHIVTIAISTAQVRQIIYNGGKIQFSGVNSKLFIKDGN